jgi:hypothetical protein
MAFRTLDRLPPLLDRGTVQVPGTDVWTAPPASAASGAVYQPLHAGFRRINGRWRFIYLLEAGR